MEVWLYEDAVLAEITLAQPQALTEAGLTETLCAVWSISMSRTFPRSY